MVNPNMEWYLLAGMSDIPKIDILLMDQPERGVIGIGEPPTVSTAAAIANAVRNATGATMRSLPLTPARRFCRRCRRREQARRNASESVCVRQSRRTRRTRSPRSTPSSRRRCRSRGGQDLLARMKDYVTQPDRIVNVKNALDATVAPDAGRRAEDRRRR